MRKRAVCLTALFLWLFYWETVYEILESFTVYSLNRHRGEGIISTIQTPTDWSVGKSRKKERIYGKIKR